MGRRGRRWPTALAAAVLTVALTGPAPPPATAQDAGAAGDSGGTGDRAQCAVPQEGTPLPVDVPLPHDRTTGAGVGVALVDTGASGPAVVAGDGLPDSTDHDHCQLHGTAVAGVVHAVAPDAVVVSHRQVTDHGSGTVAGLVDALDRAVAHARTSGDGAPRVRVVNMSLVACQDTAELRRAVADAEDAGLLVVAAAGNTGQCREDETPFPASLPGVLTVGGVDLRRSDAATLDDLGPGRQAADYSVPGPWVDLAAPGGPVSAVLETGVRTVTVVGDPEPFVGTSFAAPVVAAAAALVWQVRPDLTAAQMRILLVETATPGPVRVVDPAAAVTAATAGEPVAAGAGGVPWPAQVTPVTVTHRAVDLRVPAALVALVLLAGLGTVVRRRPR